MSQTEHEASQVLEKTSVRNMKAEIEIKISHIQQKSYWDCGIACVAMVLGPSRGATLMSDMKNVAKEEGFGTSVWTIDLAYLLKKHDIPFKYFTITFGVNPGYCEERFYTDVLGLDEERVKERFKSAEAHCVPVEFRSLSLEEILTHLASSHPAIVLVNANLLCCDSCELYLCKPGNLLKCACWSGKTPFHGHFVVVCGFNLPTEKILYRNPNYRDRVCRTSFETFETARRAFGTDDDAIFLYEFEPGLENEVALKNDTKEDITLS